MDNRQRFNRHVQHLPTAQARTDKEMSEKGLPVGRWNVTGGGSTDVHNLLPEHARDDQEVSEKGLPAGRWNVTGGCSRRGGTYILPVKRSDSHAE